MNPVTKRPLDASKGAEQSEETFSLAALRQGDAAEFARLVDAYSGMIYRLASRMLQNPQDAEDVLQETFIKAYKALPAFDGRSKLSTWLYRIATNEALMLLRKKTLPTVSVNAPLEDADPEGFELEIVDWCCLPESELMSEEARRYLDESIEALPETLKSVFVLRDLEGLSVRQTAEVLGISEGAVKTRLHRARLALREMLTAYFKERLPASGL
ncbi:MAG: sigma-70 family RNA polymerase sigma factor [Anaerolineae bacterium]|nr:MAG: sigma-70 family RNA polymerase sigma factor [Anaerolineae bacterium]